MLLRNQGRRVSARAVAAGSTAPADQRRHLASLESKLSGRQTINDDFNNQKELRPWFKPPPANLNNGRCSRPVGRFPTASVT